MNIYIEASIRDNEKCLWSTKLDRWGIHSYYISGEEISPRAVPQQIQNTLRSQIIEELKEITSLLEQTIL